jgi:hypothetical protein
MAMSGGALADGWRWQEEHGGARTMWMYLADWADRLIGHVLGVEEVSFVLHAMSCPWASCDAHWQRRLSYSQL